MLAEYNVYKVCRYFSMLTFANYHQSQADVVIFHSYLNYFKFLVAAKVKCRPIAFLS